jgi:hypothetical protein
MRLLFGRYREMTFYVSKNSQIERARLYSRTDSPPPVR